MKDDDLNDLINLFYEVVHSVNADDYTETQLNTWACKNLQFLQLKTDRETDFQTPERAGMEKWKSRIVNNFLFVAKDGNKIIDFVELSSDGYIDMLYVHKDYLRQSVGQNLLNCFIKKAKTMDLIEMFTEA